MERLLQQGPIIDPSCFLGTHLDVVEGFSSGGFVNSEEEEAQFLMSSLEDKIPFLQMLQAGSVDSDSSPPFFPVKEPNFQTLLKLQHLQNPWGDIATTNSSYFTDTTETQAAQALELESCVTHEIADLQSSPVKSETQDLHQINPHSNSCVTDQGLISPDEPIKKLRKDSSFPWSLPQNHKTKSSSSSPLLVPSRERKKRKRAKPMKNKEEVESQRMTHIAVERNRRRQMNDHLNSLRSLMPPSYVQRGDQASIIGGAIDFVKELEQLLQSLESERRIIRTTTEEQEAETLTRISSNSLSALQHIESDEDGGGAAASEAKRTSEAAEIEVAAVQNHVNLKIQCERNQSKLLRAIIALEDLRLTVLHLNITSSDTRALYSFNLKIEEDCKLGSVDEVAATVNQIFSNS